MRDISIKIDRIRLVKEYWGICFMDMIEVRYKIEEEGKRTKKRKTRYVLRDLAKEKEKIIDILNDKDRLLDEIEKRVVIEVKEEILEREYRNGIEVARKELKTIGGIRNGR